MLTVLLSAVLVAVVSADSIPQFVVPGKCANVLVQNNFDLHQYSGRWYQTSIIDNPYQPFTRCIHSNFENSALDNGFQVTTAGFSSSNEYLRMMGKIYPTKDFPAAHMLVDFPNTIAAPFQVIATDYHTYSCVYSCIAFDGYKAEFGFIYSRTPQTSGPATDKCAAVFRANGVNVSAFKSVSHAADCVYRA
ncbi:crustacyanin-A2 subunit-like [Penaeus monodon]|uniref:crustacyanin-A2 subunit-like n=1 Tax=Penaeus monodon TaxID=6687 RepID=UPI0018A74689|nr:crustacyanin-A2 subunit-like [Penaeus monodon]